MVGLLQWNNPNNTVASFVDIKMSQRSSSLNLTVTQEELQESLNSYFNQSENVFSSPGRL